MKPYLISKTFDLVRLYDADGKAMFDSNNLAIYVQGQSPSVPTNNGIGVLADAVSCNVAYELNGQDELVMTYPISGQLFDQIELRDLIVAAVGRRGNQPYRIYRITKPLNGIVTIYARHLAYDLSGIVVEPFSASNIVDALAGLKSHAMTNNPFTFSTSRSTNANFTVKTPDSVWALMGGQEGSLLDVYGGEYTFDGYNISLENSVGSNNGVSVRYGVNMTDLEQDENIADCYTGVVAYWQNNSEDGENNAVYSPVVAAVGTYGYVKILPVDMSDRWETAPSVERLTQAAQTYITANKIGVPKVSWQVGFVPLDMTEEYKDIAALERVSMGDTVTVKFDKLGVDATARVNKIEWDVLQDRYDSVSLGSVKSNIATTIANQSFELKKVPTNKQVRDLAAAISTTLTKTILGASGGSVRFLDTDGDGEPDTLYIADNPDPSLATKVWRFNYEGWGASSNGYNGPFVLGATLDNGLLASFVTAANLTAGRIRSADGTTFDLDLDNGTLSIGGYATDADVSAVQSTANSALSAANGANAQEQLIYISKTSGTSSVSKKTTWVSDTTGNQNTWTLKRPQYSSSYPVLFVATQRKTVDGTITCTTPLVDETTTVIDGGHITTGAIDAGRITTGTMSADRINGGTLTIGGSNNADGVIHLIDRNGNDLGWLRNDAFTLMGSYAASDIYTQLQDAALSMACGVSPTFKQMVYLGIGSFTDSSAAYGVLYLYGPSGSNAIALNGSTGRISANEFYTSDTNGNHNITWTSKGVGIPSGTDILTLGTGRYYCENNSTAAGLANCPTSSNFALFVFDRNASSNRRNFVIHDALNNVYVNAQTGTATYTGWKKITTTSV